MLVIRPINSLSWKESKMNIFSKSIRAFFLLLAVPYLVLGQVKLAQSGGQFLSVDSDARAGGMAGALTSIEMNSAAVFSNPAGMSRMSGTVDVAASQNQWFADINYNAFSAAFKPGNGNLGVFALSFVSVNYGEFQGTMVAENNQGYVDTEIFVPSAYAMGMGYARALNDKFSVGGHVKFVGLDYGKGVFPDEDGNPDTVKSFLAFANAFDFGTNYRTGWKSLAFGMSVRNFSSELTFEKEGFQLPLTFTLGISMDLMDLNRNMFGSQNLYMSLDALHYRSHAEQIKIGFEYKPINMISFRTGFMTATDENDLTFGVGIEQFGLKFDYAYEPFGRLGDVQRMTIRFSI